MALPKTLVLIGACLILFVAVMAAAKDEAVEANAEANTVQPEYTGYGGYGGGYGDRDGYGGYYGGRDGYGRGGYGPGYGGYGGRGGYGGYGGRGGYRGGYGGYGGYPGYGRGH